MLNQNRKNRTERYDFLKLSCPKDRITRSTLVSFIIFTCIILQGCLPEYGLYAVGTAMILDNLSRQQPPQKIQPKQPIRVSPNQVVATVNYPKTQPSNIVEPPKEMPPELILANAVSSYKNLNWDEAKRLFTEVLGKNNLSQTSKWKCLVYLGAISYQNGNLIDAEKYFIRAVGEDSKTLPAESVFPLHMINFYKSVRKRNV